MLKGKEIISPEQETLIRAFPRIGGSEQFYLTGGTALSEFYFGHRQSHDLDFFTTEPDLVIPTRVQLAHDSPYRFEAPVQSEYGVLVNDYLDIVVDKLLAFFGRWTHRDAVDLCFILESEDPKILFERAKEKDPGFDLYWLAIALKQVGEFPDALAEWDVAMISSFDVISAKKRLLNLSDEILRRLVD